MRRQFASFLLRLILNTVGIWVAVRLLGGSSYDLSNSAVIGSVFLAGFIFSIVNATIKPLLVVLSLPVILLTLGLFTLIVNGLMVYLSIGLTPGLSMTFGDSILAGLVLSLVNYIVSSALDLNKAQQN